MCLYCYQHNKEGERVDEYDYCYKGDRKLSSGIEGDSIVFQKYNTEINCAKEIKDIARVLYEGVPSKEMYTIIQELREIADKLGKEFSDSKI